MTSYFVFLTLPPELFTLIHLQGDMGFQGRAGPPGPPGIGEPGLPVSIQAEGQKYSSSTIILFANQPTLTLHPYI